MYVIPPSTWRQASPALRDQFLNALDRRDTVAINATARDLQGCLNTLPGATCILLGLAHGSTYGDAAEAVTRADAQPTLPASDKI